MGIIKKAMPVGNGQPLDPLILGRAYQQTFDFTSQAAISFSLNIDSTTGLDNVQSVFVDNSNSSTPFYMAISITGELIVCPPYSQGFFPVLYPKGSNFQAACRSAGLTTVSVQIMNMPMDLNIWSVTSPAAAGVQTVQGTVSVKPVSGAWTNRSGAVAAGGTSQPLMSANGTRQRLLIKNPASVNGQIQGGNTLESLYINYSGAAGVDDGVSIELLPGEQHDTGTGPVSTEAMTVTAATTGHRYIAREM